MLLKEGHRGIADTWIRQEDGTTERLTVCQDYENQTVCCGTNDGDYYYYYGANSTQENYLLDKKSMRENGHDFRNLFEIFSDSRPNKCLLYETAFRAQLQDKISEQKTSNLRKSKY